MSIKPEELKQAMYISRENFERVRSLKDEYAMHKCYISKNFVAFGSDDFVALQAIPDTHRVVSVEDLKLLLSFAPDEKPEQVPERLAPMFYFTLTANGDKKIAERICSIRAIIDNK